MNKLSKFLPKEDDVPKFRKRKGSSVSKASSKAKHKHQYKECLLVCDGEPCRASYCTVCGKVNEVYFFEMERQNGFLRMLEPDEVFKKYEHLEQREVTDFRQGYVPVESEEK